MARPRVGGPVLAALLLPLACPPTSIPTHEQKGGHYLASPYGVYDLEPTSVAPRSLSALEVSLPLWDLDASLAEFEAQLAPEQPPDWAAWIAWALADASGRDDAHKHLIDALASAELSAEHLAWWRSIAPDPAIALRTALDRSKSARTRALLTTTLALTEYARSCPVPVDVDGACRAPGTDLLLRRSEIPLEVARQWTKLARKHWVKLGLDAEPLAVRALWAELELAAASLDYESLLDAELPIDLSFAVEDWRRDSGVREWEQEYARQVARAEDSKARFGAWLASTMACTRAQLDLHDELLWIDARSSGVVLLRNARMLIAFAEALATAGERETVRVFGTKAKLTYAGSSQTDPIWEQAQQYLDLCLEHSRMTLDEPIERACVATLAQLDPTSVQPLTELMGEPRATSTVHHLGVVASPD